ncbi:DUF2207 domain-containing protein [Sphingomonas jaspsi]|uniref:DUF2207 domain-containing protein n=1 Tax=Sphingomonas jaspsi TaxID=392409 RepID=UPI0004B96A59|nr:DUF2207 domain-containing protein [Sphingomonas jaspsi]
MRLIAALVALLAFASAPASADERITSYDSRIAIQPDGSIDVTETIDVNVENVQINHGIYRDFPTRYKGKHGERIRVGFDLAGTQLDGRDEPYKVESIGNGVRIKIGSADRIVPIGAHRYVIHYRATRMLGRFDQYDELYWNVTGNGWIFPIDRASATITLPKPASFTQAAAYTGRQGDNTGHSRVSSQTAQSISFVTTSPLGSNEGLTVAAGFPKGVVADADASTKLGWWLSDVAPPGIAVAGLIALVAFLFNAYRRAGRDPEAGTVVPIFSPPDGLSPAAMRYVLKQKFDNRGFAAALVQAAVKGHVKIEEESALLGLSRRRYIVGTSSPNAQLLDDAEHAAITRLVGPGERLEMDNQNHATFSAASNIMSDRFDERFAGKLFNRNLGWAFAALVVWGLAVVLTADAIAYGDGIIPASFALAPALLLIGALVLWKFLPQSSGGGCVAKALPYVVGAIALVIGFPLLPMALSTGNWIPLGITFLGLPLALSTFAWIDAPTKEGRAVLDRIAGFKQYLSVTERERLDRMHAPQDSIELFEKYLPYAIALDVENRWADRFASTLAAASAVATASGSQPFMWYSGNYDPWSDTGGFVNSLGSSLSSTISSASTAPGSSSGSGGGGFSGGGGGGGGGGGW